MATTSIWRVNGWLGKVLIYIENPDKTENPDFFEKQDMDIQTRPKILISLKSRIWMARRLRALRM